jgi:carbon-monoxide dehydrogenase medium subunit
LVAVNPAPVLVREVESLLAGRHFTPELAEAVAQAVVRIGKPLTTSMSTPEYRREMLRVFSRRALRELWRENGSH